MMMIFNLLFVKYCIISFLDEKRERFKQKWYLVNVNISTIEQIGPRSALWINLFVNRDQNQKSI